MSIPQEPAASWTPPDDPTAEQPSGAWRRLSGDGPLPRDRSDGWSGAGDYHGEPNRKHTHMEGHQLSYPLPFRDGALDWGDVPPEMPHKPRRRLPQLPMPTPPASAPAVMRARSASDDELSDRDMLHLLSRFATRIAIGPRRKREDRGPKEDLA